MNSVKNLREIKVTNLTTEMTTGSEFVTSTSVNQWSKAVTSETRTSNSRTWIVRRLVVSQGKVQLEGHTPVNAFHSPVNAVTKSHPKVSQIKPTRVRARTGVIPENRPSNNW